MNNTEPTHVTDTSSTLIDHVFGKLNHFADSTVEVCDTLGLLDHRLGNIRLQGQSLRCERAGARRLGITDYARLKSILQEMNWNEFYEMHNPVQQADYLKDQCTQALSTCTTIRTARVRHLPIREWMTEGLVRAINVRKKLYRIHKKYNTLSTKLRYESYNM